MNIERKDIRQFQRVAKKATPLEIIRVDVQIEAPSDSLARSDASAAKRWADVREFDGLSVGEDTDARLTAIKTNLVIGDRDSAVLGVIGLLRDRLEQLRIDNHIKWLADDQFMKIAENLGINKLKMDSPIRIAYEEFKSLAH